MAKKVKHGGLPLFPPPSDWVPPNLSELPSWKGQRVAGFDVEADDPTLRELGIGVRRGAQMCGYSFAFEDGRKWYVPFRHKGGGNVDEKNAIRYLIDQFAQFDGELVGLGLQLDIDFANSEGAFLKSVKFIRDVGVIDAMIYELHLSYKLDAVLARLDLPLKNETLLRAAALEHGYDPKKDIHKLHSKYVGPYGGDDSSLPILAYRAQQRVIDACGLQRCVDTESRLLPVLLRMRQRGVALDYDQLDRVDAKAKQDEKDQLAFVKDQTGVDIGFGNTNKKPLLAAALQAIGVNVKKNAKGVFLVDKTVYNIDHPVAKAIGAAKKAAKRQSFCDSLRRHATNGRIHTTYIQSVGGGSGKAGKKKDTEGPTGGRLSSRHPNNQQNPNDPDFRACFKADDGSFWACLDYSQQEPRMTTHVAAKLNLPGAREAAQAYHDDPTIDNHEFMAKLTGLDRGYAKALFLGLCYGEGGAKLCRSLKLPTRWAVFMTDTRRIRHFETRVEAFKFRKNYNGQVRIWEAAGTEGQAIIDQFHARVPYVKALADACRDKVKKTGEIKLYNGRVLHFPMNDKGEYMDEHKALNYKIQPECGYMMKEAIIEIDRTLPDTFIHTTNHDELDGNFQSFKEVRQVAEIMRNIKPDSLVPYRLDIEHGANWGYMKLLCSVDGCERNVPNKKVEKIYCKEHLPS